MTNTYSELYDQFMGYVEKGDEQGAKDFLIENLKNFPEETQEKLTMAFFEEALTKETTGMAELGQMQKEGVEAMGQIAKAKKILEDKAKVEKLRSDLTK